MDGVNEQGAGFVQEAGPLDDATALPSRLARYSDAKIRAMAQAEYMLSVPGYARIANLVGSCGDFMLFRHYYRQDKIRLHASNSCRTHLLCPLCAIRRGAKSMRAYLQRYRWLVDRVPSLRPYMVTLTVKDGDDLSERFRHLQEAQKLLWKRRHYLAPCFAKTVHAAVWSYEMKRGRNSGLWHPHLHMVAMCIDPPDPYALSAEWHGITGDSFIVDVRPITPHDPVSGFLEVFKYAVKFSDQPPADTLHCWLTLKGKNLLGSSGAFYGIPVTDLASDDPDAELEGQEYVEILAHHVGTHYRLYRLSEVPQRYGAMPHDQPAL